MSGNPISSQAELGARIAEAREAAGKTQAELAESVGLERSMLAKIESGSRKLSATELVELAEQLSRPLDWFVFESPPAVVSRRRDSSADYAVLDNAFEQLCRDVDFLLDRKLLSTEPRPEFEVPSSLDEATELASRARGLLDQPKGPILDLQDACERLGLLAFSLELGRESGDAVYAEVQNAGVALLNGSTDVGRRRFSLAHELGHHLVGDAYESVKGESSGSETERMLNAFAVHFLLPGHSVRQFWAESDMKLGTRLKALAIAVRFRVSWSAACSQLRNLRLVNYSTLEDLVGVEPQPWEWLELGERWVAELTPPSVPQGYAQQVIEAYRSFQLTATKTVELLRGTLQEDELPPLSDVREFNVLQDLRPLQ
jgi:Zn-dependent peptidase ImmA (M78 family)/DNA-binding XRE family transcriptional regulator